jgi:hypothetical protein
MCVSRRPRATPSRPGSPRRMPNLPTFLLRVGSRILAGSSLELRGDNRGWPFKGLPPKHPTIGIRIGRGPRHWSTAKRQVVIARCAA